MDEATEGNIEQEKQFSKYTYCKMYVSKLNNKISIISSQDRLRCIWRYI